jgi:formate dehydrogenase subunit delta
MTSESAVGAAHNGAEHGGAEHLVRMANDIGNFFRAEPVREVAIAGIANHIDKFWTKRMREKINAHIKKAGDSGLDELPREAMRRLGSPQMPTPQHGAAPQPPEH